jgi:ubiquinone/menaquinone biosynthesis C-methylase UbiE
VDFDIESIKHKIGHRDFDEYTVCALCGSSELKNKLEVEDGTKIVECKECKLWFTNPRLDEKMWEYFLCNESNKRNKNHTENLLKHGVALSKNISNQPNDWRKRRRAAHEKIYREIYRWRSKPIKRIHEVGCGIGFFIDDMKRKGIKVSGNDLNGYNCKIMKEQFQLEVWNSNFKDIKLANDSIDVVMMSDYIEHTYHPFEDILEARRVLISEGILYVHTFIIDSDPFNSLGGKWDMLWWNHVYHFSTQSLTRMIERANFRIKSVVPNVKRGLITVIAKK